MEDKSILQHALKDPIKNWILDVDKQLELTRDIIAINFDIAEPYELSIIGASEYSASDDDWACYDELETAHTSLKLFEYLDATIEWEVLLGIIVSILKELREELDVKLFSVKHITTGFVNGDLQVVHVM